MFQCFSISPTHAVKGLATCEERSIVCSGDINNPRPTMYIWDSLTLLPLHQIRGFHQTGIQHIAMSNDGSLVLSCGLDDQSSIALHRLWYESGGIDYDAVPTGPVNGAGTNRHHNQEGHPLDPPPSDLPPSDLPPPDPPPDPHPSRSNIASPNCECELLFSAPTGHEQVCHALILRNNDLVTCGPRHVSFWVSCIFHCHRPMMSVVGSVVVGGVFVVNFSSSRFSIGQ